MTTDALHPVPVPAEVAAMHIESASRHADDATPWIVDDAPSWEIEVLFSEDGAATRADAFLVVHALHLCGTGHAPSAARGRLGPCVADERAAAHALTDLARQLLDAAEQEPGGSSAGRRRQP
jgi:hypothetical protein